MLAGGMGTSGDEDEQGAHVAASANVQMRIKKQITAAGWKLGRDESIEEIVLLAVSHCICPECFPEIRDFWTAMDPSLGLGGLVSC